MRRKDGKPKRKSRRTLPTFQHGLRTHPAVAQLWQHAGFAEGSATTVASFFCGCGGLDLAFRGGFEVLGRSYPRLPFNILAAYDNHEDAIETYHLNIADDAYLADLTELPMQGIPSASLLLGGFPCQDFSSSGPKVGLSGKRGSLYLSLCEYMTLHRPSLVIAENVPHLARLNRGKYIDTILNDFESVGYRFDVWDIFCPDYGLPQSRRRLFLVGVRNDLKLFPNRPTPTHVSHHISIDNAIANLVGITDETITNQSQYFVASRASAGGGQGDHKNEIGRLAYCIRANARGRIQFHHTLDRRLTVRECARLQSFPDQFAFPYTTQRNLTLIGNAVPPIVGYRVAQSAAEFFAALDSQTEENSVRMQKSHSIWRVSSPGERRVPAGS